MFVVADLLVGMCSWKKKKEMMKAWCLVVAMKIAAMFWNETWDASWFLPMPLLTTWDMLKCDFCNAMFFPFHRRAAGWLGDGPGTWIHFDWRVFLSRRLRDFFFCSFFFSFSPDFVGFLICYWRNKGRGGRESWWEWNEKCAMKFAMLLWYEEEYFFVMLRDAVFFCFLARFRAGALLCPKIVEAFFSLPLDGIGFLKLLSNKIYKNHTKLQKK